MSYDPYDLGGPLVSSLMASSGAQQSEFASADGTFHVVYVQSARNLGNYNDAIAWVEAIRAATAPWQGRDGCRLGFTGEPAYVASISASMQGDMTSSGVVTMLVIALIFWGVYRRMRPLIELQVMLLVIFLVTLAAAGLFLDQLTVIGVGCAAIMIGLSVDYGYFVYQRARHFEGTLRELQRQCLGYIMWTAGTTAAAFFALNVSSLPGLAQLGNLVGVGVVVGAVVMLTVFAPADPAAAATGRGTRRAIGGRAAGRVAALLPDGRVGDVRAGAGVARRAGVARFSPARISRPNRSGRVTVGQTTRWTSSPGD